MMADDGEPRIEIIEQPYPINGKFSYESSSLCSIHGWHTTTEKPVYPKIRIVGLNTSALVAVYCVTAAAPYKPHPFKLKSLLGRGQKDGVIIYQVEPSRNELELESIGIQKISRNKLFEEYGKLNNKLIDPFRPGFHDRTVDVKSFDLRVVRLCFEARLLDSTKARFTKALKPVISWPIHDSSSYKHLRIVCFEPSETLADGGDELTIWSSQILSSDVKVTFSSPSTDAPFTIIVDPLPRQEGDSPTAVTVITPSYPRSKYKARKHVCISLRDCQSDRRSISSTIRLCPSETRDRHLRPTISTAALQWPSSGTQLASSTNVSGGQATYLEAGETSGTVPLFFPPASHSQNDPEQYSTNFSGIQLVSSTNALGTQAYYPQEGAASGAVSFFYPPASHSQNNPEESSTNYSGTQYVYPINVSGAQTYYPEEGAAGGVVPFFLPPASHSQNYPEQFSTNYSTTQLVSSTTVSGTQVYYPDGGQASAVVPYSFFPVLYVHSQNNPEQFSTNVSGTQAYYPEGGESSGAGSFFFPPASSHSQDYPEQFSTSVSGAQAYYPEEGETSGAVSLPLVPASNSQNYPQQFSTNFSGTEYVYPTNSSASQVYYPEGGISSRDVPSFLPPASHSQNDPEQFSTNYSTTQLASCDRCDLVTNVSVATPHVDFVLPTNFSESQVYYPEGSETSGVVSSAVVSGSYDRNQPEESSINSPGGPFWSTNDSPEAQVVSSTTSVETQTYHHEVDESDRAESSISEPASHRENESPPKLQKDNTDQSGSSTENEQSEF